MNKKYQITLHFLNQSEEIITNYLAPGLGYYLMHHNKPYAITIERKIFPFNQNLVMELMNGFITEEEFFNSEVLALYRNKETISLANFVLDPFWLWYTTKEDPNTVILIDDDELYSQPLDTKIFQKINL